MSPGPGKSTMSNINLSSNSNSQNLMIPKLCDDGSNWADYEPQVMIAMKAKGIWKHVQGAAYKLQPYTNVGVHPLSDRKTHTTEEQIMERERKRLMNTSGSKTLHDTTSSQLHRFILAQRSKTSSQQRRCGRR